MFTTALGDLIFFEECKLCTSAKPFKFSVLSTTHARKPGARACRHLVVARYPPEKAVGRSNSHHADTVESLYPSQAEACRPSSSHTYMPK